jgi:hypothetical protein
MAEYESNHTLKFTGFGPNGATRLDALISTLIIAGWTGRDAAALEAHISELEVLGVARPKTTPSFYRTSASLVTQRPTIEVVGGYSSGEVEPVLVSLANGLWLGIGSDHTDRKLETVGVTISKQLCPKPIGLELWQFDDVDAHWDQIVIRSFAWKQGTRRLYQDGPLKNIRHPRDLIARYCGQAKACPLVQPCSAVPSPCATRSNRPSALNLRSRTPSARGQSSTTIL